MERDGGEEWKLRRGDKIWWRREGDGKSKEGRKELENMWEGGRGGKGERGLVLSMVIESLCGFHYTDTPLNESNLAVAVIQHEELHISPLSPEQSRSPLIF